MTDRTINLTAKIANIKAIRDELAKLKVDIKINSKEFKDLQKLTKGLIIPIKFEMPKEFKQLLDLQKNGIKITGGVGRQASGPRQSKEQFGPFRPEGLARTQQDVANARANASLAREEIAFRQKVNEIHQKNLRNEEFIAAERAKNNRILLDLQKAQIARRSREARQGASLDGSFTPFVNGVRQGSSNRIYPGLSAKGQQFYTKQIDDQFKIVSRQMEKMVAERRKDTDRRLKDLFAAQASLDGSFSPLVGGFRPGARSRVNYTQQARMARSLDGSFSEFVGGVPVGSSSRVDLVARRRLLNQQKQDAKLDGSYSELVNGVKPGASSKIYASLNLRNQRAAQKATEALEKANEYVRNNPLAALLGEDVRTQASKKFGVGRGAITSSPNFFDPKRIFKKDNFKDILYTGLLGGPAQGIGAAVGAATFDRGGSLIGANVAAATIAVFEKIADSLGKAVRAGAEYERAVTGITGIFQATSEVIDKDGNPVDIRTALGFQRQRAEKIQAASQRALLPLGISGEAASALTKSYASGLAQRGIAPDEKSSEIVIRRLGAAIQTLQPELANDANALQRTVEDIIGGSPQAQRTELGSAIKGLAPGLFSGGAKTQEDIVKATAALEQLVIAIKNNDTASVQWQKALGSLQLAQQELGKGILEGIAPGLKALAEELNKADAQSTLKEVGKAIGELATTLIKDLLPAVKAITGALPTGIKVGGAILQGSTPLGGFSKSIGEAAKTLNFLLGKTGDEGLPALNEKRVAAGKLAYERGPDGQLREVIPSEEEQLKALNEKRKSKGLSTKSISAEGLVDNNDGEKNQKLFLQDSLNILFKKASVNFGITDPSEDTGVKDLAENRLRGLNKLRSDLSGRKGRDPKDVLTNAISLNSQEIGIRRQRQSEKNELFDDSEAGQLSRALSEKGGLRDILKLAEDNVAKRKQLLTVVSTVTDKQLKDEEAIAKARLGIKQAEDEVIKIRKETLAKEKEIAEKRVNLLRRAAAAEDSGTIAGRFAALNKEGKANSTERDLINDRIKEAQRVLDDPLASAQDKVNARNAIIEENINKVGNASKEADRQRREQREQFNKDTSPLRNSLRKEAFQDSQKSVDIGLKQLEISTKELTLEQSKLARATADANKALKDFADQSRLRELGRQGEEIAAAEAIVAAGGSVPAGISESLVRGSESFDPLARAEFEERLAREKFSAVKSKNDYERTTEEGSFGTKTKELQDNVTQLGFDKEKLNLKPEELALQKRGLGRQRKQNALNEADAALNELLQDPTNPQLQQNYAEAKKALDGIQNEGTGLPALGVPQGSPSTRPGYERLPDGRPKYINPDGSPASFGDGKFSPGEKPGDRERLQANFPHIYDGLGRVQDANSTFSINGDEISGAGASSDYFDKNKNYYDIQEKYYEGVGFLDSSPPRRRPSTGIKFNPDGSVAGGLTKATSAPQLSAAELAQLPGDERDQYLKTGFIHPETLKTMREVAPGFGRTGLFKPTKGADLSYNSGGGYGNNPEDLTDVQKGAGKLFGFDPTKESLDFPQALDDARRYGGGQYLRDFQRKGTPTSYLKDLDDGKDAFGQLLNYNTTIGPGGLPNPEMLVASNDIGSAILGGISGTGAYGRAKSASDKGTQAATDILRGLGAKTERAKEDKEKGDRGNSIFDDLTALKPLSQSQTRDAFIEALNSSFV